MKELIIQALIKANLVLEKQIPQTKKQMESMNILSMKPLEIAQLMKDNNIPDDAFFNSSDDYEIFISWYIDVPTNNADKLQFAKKRFSDIAWKCVYDLLLENGYKRVGYNSGLLKEFKDTTVYQMYLHQEFDRLVKYYSLSFKKD